MHLRILSSSFNKTNHGKIDRKHLNVTLFQNILELYSQLFWKVSDNCKYYQINYLRFLSNIRHIYDIRGPPLITYAPRGVGGGGGRLIHFHCVLHAKRGLGVEI